MTTHQLEHHDIGLLDNAEYITDRQGKIKSVIIDYATFLELEEILLDQGLGRAMDEVAHDELVDLETAKRMAGFKA